MSSIIHMETEQARVVARKLDQISSDIQREITSSFLFCYSRLESYVTQNVPKVSLEEDVEPFDPSGRCVK